MILADGESGISPNLTSLPSSPVRQGDVEHAAEWHLGSAANLMNS